MMSAADMYESMPDLQQLLNQQWATIAQQRYLRYQFLVVRRDQ
jgi:hypothetical protein